MIGVDRIILYL